MGHASALYADSAAKEVRTPGPGPRLMLVHMERFIIACSDQGYLTCKDGAMSEGPECDFGYKV